MLILQNFYLLVWLFAIYSFIGWLTEVIYSTYTYKKFVNRGFLFGPFCPIYGFGILFVISLVSHLQSNIFLFFLGAVLITSLIEFITGIVLEILFHTQWWDYSNEKFNFKGLVCLRFSLYWGFLSIIVVKFIHPMVLILAHFFIDKFSNLGALLVIGYFLCDFTATIISLYGIKHVLEALNNLKTKYETEVAVLHQHDIFPFVDLQHLRDDFEKAQNQIIGHLRHHYVKLIRSFPDLRSSRYRIIDDLKQKLKVNRPVIK